MDECLLELARGAIAGLRAPGDRLRGREAVDLEGMLHGDDREGGAEEHE